MTPRQQRERLEAALDGLLVMESIMRTRWAREQARLPKESRLPAEGAVDVHGRPLLADVLVGQVNALLALGALRDD